MMCKPEIFNNSKLIMIVWRSRVLAGRPAGRADASAPLSAGAASPPPVGMEGGESAAHEFTS